MSRARLMNIFSSIFQILFFLFVLSSAAFILTPSEKCQRLDNASAIFYGAVGIVPFSAENFLKLDAKKEWRDAERYVLYFYNTVAQYFNIDNICTAPSMRPWGAARPDNEIIEWLKINDKELYESLNISDGFNKNDE